MPVVSFARLYSLRQEIESTHTIERLEALVEERTIQETSYQEITTTYDFLMRLRLRHQTQSSASNQTPENTINCRRLGQTEQTLLHESFAQISAIQKRISYDFLGGTV